MSPLFEGTDEELLETIATKIAARFNVPAAESRDLAADAIAACEAHGGNPRALDEMDRIIDVVVRSWIALRAGKEPERRRLTGDDRQLQAEVEARIARAHPGLAANDVTDFAESLIRIMNSSGEDPRDEIVLNSALNRLVPAWARARAARG